MSERRPRGIRLGDLDRGTVYRIAYSGRRWEVLGAEDAPQTRGRPEAGGGAQGEAGTAGGTGRHAAAEHSRIEDHPV
jgi:hypothetical protein